MSEKSFKTFQKFWPFYLKEHSQPANRAFHFLGTTLALISLCWVIANSEWNLIWIPFYLGYGNAWIGHFFIQKNRPATFRYPLYSLRGDIKLYYLMWLRKIPKEFSRLGIRHS